MVDLITLDLKLAFDKPGCPLCRLRQEAEQRYLFHLLYENVNDGTTRLLLVRSMGFCFRHAWLCQAIEWEEWEDGLGTGTIYEGLISGITSLLTDFVQRACSVEKGGKLSIQLRRIPFLRGWLSWPKEHAGTTVHSAGHIRPPTPVCDLLEHLWPTATCPACRVVDRSESIMLTWLVQQMKNDEFRSWYAASDGLCLPHLRCALSQVTDQPSADHLVHHTTVQLEKLLRAFREHGGNDSQGDQSDVQVDDEETVGMRLIAFLVGECATFGGLFHPAALSAHAGPAVPVANVAG